MKAMKGFLVLFLAVSCFPLWAAERVDYDLDDDGLIEIDDLYDLNDIRNNVSEGDFPQILGDKLYGSNDGCPVSGCSGYELSTDLNLDSNGNGQFDADDVFWNDGKGWDPIGSFFVKFNTEFHGNGFSITNLVMRRSGSPFSAFIAYSEFGYLHDFTITADLVTGAESAGILAYGWNTRLERIKADIKITAEAADESCISKCDPQIIGSIVGSAVESELKNIVVNAQVAGSDRLGGVGGDIYDSNVGEIAVQVKLNGSDNVGGLAGSITNGVVESVAIFADIEGRASVGGLAGSTGGTSGVNIDNVLISGTVTPGVNITRYARGGALLGRATSEDQIDHIISTVHLPNDEEANHFIGALIGRGDHPTINNAIWAKDLALRDTMYYEGSSRNIGQNWDLIDLQCATEANNCNGLSFNAFANELNSESSSLWSFGETYHSPALNLPEGRFIDSDSNGEADSWPDLQLPEVPEATPSSSGGGMFYALLSLVLLTLRKKPFLSK